MQGIFAGRTQLRYPYGRYGYTRGGGKIWHGGMDLVGLDSTDIRMPYYKNKRITGKVVRARRVTDHSNKTWEWGWYVCVQLDPGQTPRRRELSVLLPLPRAESDGGAGGGQRRPVGRDGPKRQRGGRLRPLPLRGPRHGCRQGPGPSQYAGCPNAVGVYGEAPGQADSGEKNKENADAAKKLQRISIDW